MKAAKFEPVGVAGLGQLGRGIATCLLSYGYQVIGFTTGPDTFERARTYTQQALEELVARAAFPENILADWRSRFIEAPELSAFAPCRFVIESVVEDLAIKLRVFDAIEAVVATDIPIASNTSAIPITLLQGTRRHPTRFLGMHWNDPAYATRFLELIRGEATSDAAFAAAAELGRALGKDAALVEKDVPGFIANRLAYAMYREAIHLLESGIADVATIDRAFHNSIGFWGSFCGPLRWIDITGGPWLYAKGMERILPTLDNGADLPLTFREALEQEHHGIKNGRGFYPYAAGDATKWEKRLREHAWRILNLHSKPGTADEE
jgi:3-hydroxybutyryl-CoA dehydrogenase